MAIMKFIKIVSSNFVFVFIAACAVHKPETLQNGLYYGKNRGFFPQDHVFVHLQQDSAHVECFLQLKGKFFRTFNDTIILNGTDSLSNVVGFVKLENGRYAFQSADSISNHKIPITIIKYSPEQEELYKKFLNIYKEW